MTNLNAFKAYDVRGRIPDEINETLAYDIGRAYAAFVKPKRVAVATISLPVPSMSQTDLARLLADAHGILVSGGMAGDAVKPDTFAEIREAVRSVNKQIPVLVNTGATAGNIAGYLAQGADGVVVGTALKKPSETEQTWNDIDPDRVREFLAAVRSA